MAVDHQESLRPLRNDLEFDLKFQHHNNILVFYDVVKVFTTRISIKEQYRNSEYSLEHSVVEDTGGIDTDIIEGHGSDETHDDSMES